MFHEATNGARNTRATSKRKKHAEDSIVMAEENSYWEIFEHVDSHYPMLVRFCDVCKNILTNKCRHGANCTMNSARIKFNFIIDPLNWQSLHDTMSQWERVKKTKKTQLMNPRKNIRCVYIGCPVQCCVRQLIQGMPLFLNITSDIIAIDKHNFRKYIWTFVKQSMDQHFPICLLDCVVYFLL